ncbi:unnamed protein product, partial [Thlaspi arvense]
ALIVRIGDRKILKNKYGGISETLADTSAESPVVGSRTASLFSGVISPSILTVLLLSRLPRFFSLRICHQIMNMFSCFAGLISRNKNHKRIPKPSLPPRTQRILQIRLEEPVKPLENDEPSHDNKSIGHKDSPFEQESCDGEDEHDDDKDSTKCESPKSQVQERAVAPLTRKELGKEVTDCSENGDGDDDDEEGGHVSDPGLGRATAWVTSPKLKRSCSTLSKFNGSDPRALHDLRETVPASNQSVRSHRSADRVMLKKHSSMQILPSGSRRLWWKLFLWSHRNLHKHLVSLKSQPLGVVSAKNHQSGYTSDFADHDQSSHEDSANNQSSSLWPRHNQWVAFSAGSSSMKRVDEWVRGLDVETVVPLNDDEDKHSFIASPTTVRSPSGNVSEAILHANSLIQSLSKSSSVAHISSIGLNAVPSISHFTSLKSIDLSNNFLVQITPASLPKGLHALNLSKNKISVIEGLRDLTRLRVLDLSYNRISRIGQVANYNSLVALNILGNPIQSNVGEDQLRKTVSSLLPKLVYLNKQLIKPQRAREVLKDSVAKAAFGGGDSLHHRRKRTATKRAVRSLSASSSFNHRSHNGDDKQKGKGRGSKGRSQHQLRKTSIAEIPSH